MQNRYTWESLNRLLEYSGGCAYIAHLDKFIGNARRMISAFRSVYAKTYIGYSYKTNNLPIFCKEAHKMGMYAEVVSGEEYEMAALLGVPGNKILFNGPIKSRDELERAIRSGATINIDSLEEARLIIEISKCIETEVYVGVRCNTDLFWDEPVSRFGLSYKNGDLQQATRMLSSTPNVKIDGLHCHNSYKRSLESYNKRTAGLIQFSDEMGLSNSLRFLDIGGGICGPMPIDLRRQFKFSVPSYEEYAEAICSVMRDRYGDHGPQLIIEPGIGLVGDTLDYVYRVECVKRIGYRKIAITTGAMHHIKIFPNDINLPLKVYKREQSQKSSDTQCVDVTGYTCLENDVLYSSLQSVLEPGDILVTRNVGAYSLVSSSDFIRTKPPVVIWTADFDWRQIRKKSTIEEFLSVFK